MSQENENVLDVDVVFSPSTRSRTHTMVSPNSHKKSPNKITLPGKAVSKVDCDRNLLNTLFMLFMGSSYPVTPRGGCNGRQYSPQNSHWFLQRFEEWYVANSVALAAFDTSKVTAVGMGQLISSYINECANGRKLCRLSLAVDENNEPIKDNTRLHTYICSELDGVLPDHMVLIDRRELEQLKQKQEDSAVHRSVASAAEYYANNNTNYSTSAQIILCEILSHSQLSIGRVPSTIGLCFLLFAHLTCMDTALFAIKTIVNMLPSRRAITRSLVRVDTLNVYSSFLKLKESVFVSVSMDQ